MQTPYLRIFIASSAKYVIDDKNVLGYKLRMDTKKLRLDLRPDSQLLAIIDRWRAQQPDVPPRAEAVRRMVKLANKIDKNRSAENA